MPAPGRGDGGGGLVDHTKEISLCEVYHPKNGCQDIPCPFWQVGLGMRRPPALFFPCQECGQISATPGFFHALGAEPEVNRTW